MAVTAAKQNATEKPYDSFILITLVYNDEYNLYIYGTYSYVLYKQ